MRLIDRMFVSKWFLDKLSPATVNALRSAPVWAIDQVAERYYENPPSRDEVLRVIFPPFLPLFVEFAASRSVDGHTPTGNLIPHGMRFGILFELNREFSDPTIAEIVKRVGTSKYVSASLFALAPGRETEGAIVSEFLYLFKNDTFVARPDGLPVILVRAGEAVGRRVIERGGKGLLNDMLERLPFLFLGVAWDAFRLVQDGYAETRIHTPRTDTPDLYRSHYQRYGVGLRDYTTIRWIE